MELAEAFAQERRARLAAERLLAQKQAELSLANRELSRHARRLSAEIDETRQEVAGVRTDLRAAEGKATLAERRLWTALGSIRDGFALFDSADRLVAANPAWLRPFDGIAEVAPGLPYAHLLDLALQEGVVDIGAEPPDGWRARMLARRAARRPDPVTLRLWNGAFVRLVDSRGPGGDRVTMALDMTRHMRRMARLRAARQKAEAAASAKSAFLANMSHELRTPLNGVVAMADLLAESLAESRADGGQRVLVDTIRSSGEALLALIGDILDVSRLDAGRMELQAAPFDLEELAQSVARLVRPLAGDKPLRLVVDYDIFLPARFIGDAGRLRQVLTNLVGNAVKFTDRGEVRLRITGHGMEGRGAEGDGGCWQVHVSVEDTGIGIAPEMQRFIFGEFNQVDGASTRRHEGTGLGLAITERLVRLMGGEVWVESEPGAGSCFGFRVTLPAAGEAEAAMPDLHPGLHSGLRPDLHPDLRNVLLVHPDAARAALLSGALSGMGLSVRRAADGLSALSELTDDLGLVLTAPVLPDLPVAELARGLSEGTAALPLLVLDEGDPAAARRQGLPLLPSPPDRAALRMALARLAAVPQAGPEPRPMRVLAADDNATNRLVLRKMLEGLPLDLRFAADGAEAVRLWQDRRPDLVLMDISMPGMDGREATRRIRAAEAGAGLRTTVIALTAHALPGDEAEILAAGLDRYLSKPLKKPALLAELRAACPPDCIPLPPPAPPAAAEAPAAAE